MSRRVVFDVFGEFIVHAEQNEDGDWRFYRPGTDGKRARLDDVVVGPGAPLDEIERQLEAIYHEAGRPGTSIRRIDSP